MATFLMCEGGGDTLYLHQTAASNLLSTEPTGWKLTVATALRGVTAAHGFVVAPGSGLCVPDGTTEVKQFDRHLSWN